MVAPAGAPTSIIKALESELKKRIEKPEMRDAFSRSLFNHRPEQAARCATGSTRLCEIEN
jgi:hypothetical protein